MFAPMGVGSAKGKPVDADQVDISGTGTSSGNGTKLPNQDVRSSVAIGAKPDMMRIAQFGRD